MAQVVALVLLAQTGGGTGPVSVTSLRVGQFLSMSSCKAAAAQAVTVQALPDTKIGYICVPLTP